MEPANWHFLCNEESRAIEMELLVKLKKVVRENCLLWSSQMGVDPVTRVSCEIEEDRVSKLYFLVNQQW